MKRHKALARSLLAFIERQPKYIVWLATLFGLIFVGVIDYLTGQEIILGIFYLIPLALSSWAIGARAGFGTALLCAVVMTMAHSLAASANHSHYFVLAWNAGMRASVFVVFAILVAAIRNLLDEERLTAGLDPLTGMMNRRSFLSAGKSLARETDLFSVIYIDLDGFKAINDTLGHHVGDAVLQVVATTIKTSTRAADVTSRLGGDEFAVLLPKTSKDGACVAASKLKHLLGQEMEIRGWKVTCSVGVHCCSDPNCSIESLLSHADKAMYESKRGGKDRVTVSVNIQEPAIAIQ